MGLFHAVFVETNATIHIHMLGLGWCTCAGLAVHQAVHEEGIRIAARTYWAMLPVAHVRH